MSPAQREWPDTFPDVRPKETLPPKEQPVDDEYQKTLAEALKVWARHCHWRTRMMARSAFPAAAAHNRRPLARVMSRTRAS